MLNLSGETLDTVFMLLKNVDVMIQYEGRCNMDESHEYVHVFTCHPSLIKQTIRDF